MTKFILDFAIGYEFILDPPIVADIGTVNISIDNLELKFDMTTVVVNNEIQFNFT